MGKLKLHRRAVLRGVGAGVVLRLCPLEAMFDSAGNAYGQTGGAPKRFVLMFQGNGIPAAGYSGQACRWVPKSVGAGMVLNDAMTPITAAIKPYTRVMTGITIGGTTINGEPHAEALSWSLSGRGTPSPGSKLGGPTPDFIAAKTLQGSSPHRQLILGLCDGTGGSAGRMRITADDSGNLLTPEFSPQAIFNRIFANFTPPTGGGSTPPPATPTPPAVDPEQQRQRLIVDYVKKDADRLKAKLGTEDRHRLDAHLTAVRDLEVALFPPVSTPDPGTPAPNPPATSSACVKPSAPGSGGDANNDTRAKWMADLTALAFACDLTRVVSLMGTAANSEENMGFVGVPYAYHESISHLTRGQSMTTYFNEMLSITRWHLKWFDYLMAKLRTFQDVGGTVLDNTLGVFTSEFGHSHYHARFELPYLLVGGSQFIRGDFHWRSPTADKIGLNGDRNNKVWNSVLQALGCPVTAHGGVSGTVPLK